MTDRSTRDAAVTKALRGNPPDGWFGFVAVILFAILALLAGGVSATEGSAWGLLALLAVPVAIIGRRRPWLFAAALIVGGLWLRIAYTTFGEYTDQLIVSQAAFDVVLGGGNPYGIGYAESVPPGAPYPYGPLAMLWAPTWIWGEIVFAVATMVVLGWARAWLTLAFYAGFWTIVDLSTAGLNDVTPGFFILVGVLATAYRPWLGAVLLAIGAGFKPYVAAWFPGLIGVGGLSALGWLIGASLVVWLPAMIAWGPGAMVRSIEMARAIHPVSENALNMPILRLVAIPIAIAALFMRRWWMAAASGVAIFLIVLFFDFWASLGYLIAVTPIAGILVEMGLRHLFQGRRRVAAPAEVPASA